MDDLLIIGAGDFSREVAFLVEDINRLKPSWNLLGYVDSDSANVGKTIGGYTIIGDDEYVRSYEKEICVVLGIGAPKVIWSVAEKLAGFAHVRFPNLIHPSVIMDRDRVQFGQGNIVCAGNIFTTDIKIGSFNVLNLSCTFGHDTVIGDCGVINPGVNISGGVVLGNRCLIGTGAAILQYITIGDDSTVGAGAVATKNVLPGTTVIGVPARPLGKK